VVRRRGLIEEDQRRIAVALREVAEDLIVRAVLFNDVDDVLERRIAARVARRVPVVRGGDAAAVLRQRRGIRRLPDDAQFLFFHRFAVILRNEPALGVVLNLFAVGADDQVTRRLARTESGKARLALKVQGGLVQRGIDGGQFRRGADARIAAFSIIGMCSWTAWWFMPEGRVPLDEIAKSIADFAVAGLRRSDNVLPREFGTEEALRRVKDDLAHLERLIGRSDKRR